jgi:two-component system, LuxR family, sensor kinase FixL
MGTRLPMEWWIGARLARQGLMDYGLLDSVPDAMLIADQRTGQIVHANVVAQELFGYGADELVGRPVEFLIPTRFREMHLVHRGAYQAAPRTRPMGLGLSLFGLTRAGREFPVEISLSVMHAEGADFTVAAVRDLTERKRIEERARLYQQAQADLRARDEFLSIASHELRTPVAALQLQLQILQRTAGRSPEGLPAALLHRVEGLERQTRRISLLVNELLDVSRIRLGRMALNVEKSDLAQVIREAVEPLLEEVARAGSTLSIEVQPVPGCWDRLRIGQVVTNLVANAIKFGEGRPIAVSVNADDDRARLVVEDHGIGIAPEDQSRLFGRFERAVPSGNYGGLGLGLFISREIVEAHGGSIALQSSLGNGTTVLVELPRSLAIRPQSASVN